MWIAQIAVHHNLTQAEQIAISQKLAMFTSNKKVFDLSDVYRNISIYNDALQEVISVLCDKFNLATPACNYFSSNNKG